MDIKRPLIALTSLLFAHVANGAQNAACLTPDADFSKTSPIALRAIATSCENPDIERLFYNRAYASDLQADYHTYLKLIPYRRIDSQDQVNFNAYRMFLGLAEAFSTQVNGTEGDRIAWLNRAYEQANELAELRMKGYDRIADRRVREMQSDESNL
ncbi:MAG: hypothetical protein H6981_02585 [Gammaproteobacteria bacterium]|nr:hypothetical protein [Gammaproteobacteria bacterium]MCP5135676.1 hypothetical protein [Gammaproteobacteria bacterium]